MTLRNTSAARVHDDSPNVAQILACLRAQDDVLLAHTYFQLCETGQLGREKMLDVVKQLYCFSIFFERVLMRRIAEFSSHRDQRVAHIARSHLKDEIGHAELFRQCLLANGVSSHEIENVVPKMFTKALFGYLLATIAHENEYVSNVAIMQVMETIGYHFFRSTLQVMKMHEMLDQAFIAHAEDDEEHRHLGLDLADTFDDRTMADSLRIIEDVYRLMGFVLTEWLDMPVLEVSSAPYASASFRASHVTGLRPPALDAPTEQPGEAPSIRTQQQQAERSVLSFRREQVGEGVHLAHVALAKGQSSTLHQHTVTHDTFYVMSGVLTVTAYVDTSVDASYYCSTRLKVPEVEVIGDGREVHTVRLLPGEILNIAPGVLHCTSNLDDLPCQFLCIEGIGVYEFVSSASDIR
jgi:thiaminase